MYMVLQNIFAPPRFRVLEGVLGETLTLGGEEWEGKIGYLYTLV